MRTRRHLTSKKLASFFVLIINDEKVSVFGRCGCRCAKSECDAEVLRGALKRRTIAFSGHVCIALATVRRHCGEQVAVE